MSQQQITALLNAWRNGSRAAEDELMRQVYPILRDVARARVKRMPADFTLRATELVNEAYTRLAGADIEWQTLWKITSPDVGSPDSKAPIDVPRFQ